MKRVCCPRNLVYEASFRKRKRRKENSLPSKFSKPKSKLDDLFTKLVIGVRASHGKRVTRTCERRFLPATQRRARAIRTRHRDSNDLRHPDRGPERGNINGIKVRAVPPHIKNTYTCLRSTDFVILVIGVYAFACNCLFGDAETFRIRIRLFFFANLYAFCTQLETKKDGLYYTNRSSHDLFIQFNVHSKIRTEDVSSCAKRLFSFFFFFVTNDGGMEKSGNSWIIKG